jgi:hypothetical protein
VCPRTKRIKYLSVVLNWALNIDLEEALKYQRTNLDPSELVESVACTSDSFQISGIINYTFSGSDWLTWRFRLGEHPMALAAMYSFLLDRHQASDVDGAFTVNILKVHPPFI